MVVDKELPQIRDAFEIHKAEIIIYGFSLLRKELRATPKTSHIERRNLRVALLTLYDYFVGEHYLPLHKEKILPLVQNYYEMYREFGGSKGRKEMENDFMIVASASLSDLDIVVSSDSATLLSENALRAYKIANEILKLRTPNFIGYQEFKKMLL